MIVMSALLLVAAMLYSILVSALNALNETSSANLNSGGIAPTEACEVVIPPVVTNLNTASSLFQDRSRRRSRWRRTIRRPPLVECSTAAPAT